MKNIIKLAMSAMLALGCAYYAKPQACGGVDNTFFGNEKTSSALGSGNSVAGENSTAAGSSNEINGEYLFVTGYENKVFGKSSVAMGVGNNVLKKGLTEYSAFAIGYKNEVNGDKSMAFGDQNSVNKNNSFAFGRKNNVSNANSFAIGNNNTINSNASITIGYKLKNTKDCGITIGYGYNTTDKLLVNNTNGIMMGMNSDKPTLFISWSEGAGKTGKVGIGNVTNPQAKLHIKADSGENADILLDGANPYLYFRNKNNSISATTSSIVFKSQKYDFENAGITIGRNSTTQNPEISFNTSNKISVGSDNAMSFAAGGFNFNTKQDMNFSASSYSFAGGKVGIGCVNNVDGFALAVKGGVVSTEMSVMNVEAWPDFVFSGDYKRMSLYELEEYIDRNHHLPEIPSAEEVSENGIDLGEMNALLLQKVEELTLHVIELQKQIDIQQDKIDLQQNEIDELKAK